MDKTVSLHEKLFRSLPPQEYEPYTPYQPQPGELPQLWQSSFLILDNDRCDVETAKRVLAETGKVPEEYAGCIREFDTPYLDLSEYGKRRRLSLITLVDTSKLTTAPEKLVFMAAADVGLRVFLDDVRILNNHSRHKMVPAFHRVQGGAAFNLPLERTGKRRVLHVELFHYEAPAKACIMFGNTANDLCDEIKFTVN